MSSVLSALEGKYAPAAAAAQPSTAGMFAPQPQAAAPAGLPFGTLGGPVPPRSWRESWELTPPNVKPDFHERAAGWCRDKQNGWSPAQFYAEFLSKRADGLVAENALIEPKGPINPLEVPDAPPPQAAPAPQVAINSPMDFGGVGMGTAPAVSPFGGLGMPLTNPVSPGAAQEHITAQMEMFDQRPMGAPFSEYEVRVLKLFVAALREAAKDA